MKRLWVFCDGSTGAVENHRGENGCGGLIRSAEPSAPMTCGAGAVALEADGRIAGWEWRPLPAMTNNEAEYAGLLLGIGLAERLRADDTVFLLDSEIVVGQMTGRYAVNSRSLYRWHWQACAALRALPKVQFVAIPREWNRLADGLACQAGISWAWLRDEVDKETRSKGAGGQGSGRSQTISCLLIPGS
ncbi:MAG: ribonuclease HI family protein [Chloroflexi bacterium]|nr:ribonuclease HI family protein [Chloroflexota bacterium]